MCRESRLGEMQISTCPKQRVWLHRRVEYLPTFLNGTLAPAATKMFNSVWWRHRCYKPPDFSATVPWVYNCETVILPSPTRFIFTLAMNVDYFIPSCKTQLYLTLCACANPQWWKYYRPGSIRPVYIFHRHDRRTAQFCNFDDKHHALRGYSTGPTQADRSTTRICL